MIRGLSPTITDESIHSRRGKNRKQYFNPRLQTQAVDENVFRGSCRANKDRRTAKDAQGRTHYRGSSGGMS